MNEAFIWLSEFLMARNFYRIFTENNPVNGGQQNLWYSWSEGVNQLFKIYCKFERIHATETESNRLTIITSTMNYPLI